METSTKNNEQINYESNPDLLYEANENAIDDFVIDSVGVLESQENNNFTSENIISPSTLIRKQYMGIILFF